MARTTDMGHSQKINNHQKKRWNVVRSYLLVWPVQDFHAKNQIRFSFGSKSCSTEFKIHHQHYKQTRTLVYKLIHKIHTKAHKKGMLWNHELHTKENCHYLKPLLSETGTTFSIIKRSTPHVTAFTSSHFQRVQLLSKTSAVCGFSSLLMVTWPAMTRRKVSRVQFWRERESDKLSPNASQARTQLQALTSLPAYKYLQEPTQPFGCGDRLPSAVIASSVQPRLPLCQRRHAFDTQRFQSLGSGRVMDARRRECTHLPRCSEPFVEQLWRWARCSSMNWTCKYTHKYKGWTRR